MVDFGDWDIVTNDIESTTEKFGGRWGNLLSKLLNGEDIGGEYPLKRPIIRTLWRFGVGKFKIFDTEESHTLGIEVDNIDEGDGKILKVKAFTTGDVDYALTELEPQTMVSKVLGRNTGPVGQQGYVSLGHKLDAAGKDIEKLGVLGLEDLDGTNIELIESTGSDSNTNINILKDYAGIVGSTDVVLSIGENSKLHKFSLWSNIGGNKKHMELIAASNKFDFFSKIDMNEQDLSNAVLKSPDADMLNLLNTTAKTGDLTKDIIHRVDIDSANHAAYVNKRENGDQVQVRLY